MNEKQKILVCGDVEGKFKTVFSRVQAINEKNGPFDFLFCVGDFFGDSPANWLPYKNGSAKVPVPCYILGPNKPEHVQYYEDLNGCEMCPNVSYLGKRGLFTSSGLSIAYVSGLEGSESSPSVFTKKDVTAVKDIALRSKVADLTFLGVDILLTSVWPEGITSNDENCSVTGPLKDASSELGWLATHIRPRYHFASHENVYYERPPYQNFHKENETTVHCTRFIALGSVGSKNKWIYAASIAPINKIKNSELCQMTTDETKCPFPNPFIGAIRDKQFFYDMESTGNDLKKRKRDGEHDQKKRFVVDQDNCWFCLGSTAVEKHLVVSVGEKVYLALAKGGLTEYHAMLVPIQHHRSLAHLSNDIRKEVDKFKSALKKFYKSKKLYPVYFERNFKTSHMQLHIVPVPKNVAGKLKGAVLSESEEKDLELGELPKHCELEDVAQVDTPYFYMELPDSERLYCPCKKNFPLDFGREALCREEILDLPHRVSWKSCVLKKPEEIKLTENFRTEFKEYDFTNEDDSE